MPPVVLVVDDHDDARELLAVVVGAHGYGVATASNGREAVAEARRARPDLVIMDLFMPEMDGYEAARLFKADPALASVPILACTARSDLPERDMELFAAWMVKPCVPADLLATVERFLSTPPSSQGHP